MIVLGEWERGLAFWPTEAAGVRLYLWFYEWHLFDAVRAGQHTGGYWIPTKRMACDHRQAVLSHPGMALSVSATDDGADLSMEITNQSGYAWPPIAAVIPCLNPVGLSGQPLVPPTREFFDETCQRTWFVGEAGLEKLETREIHFNQAFRPAIDAQAPAGKFDWVEKWPTSPRNAGAGLMVRESADGRWVGGIGWEQFLSAQGHNPCRCMHLSVRVGPLEPGESRAVRGRLYLFAGTKDDCLARFRENFGL
ncbi:MAG: hypothetical protein JXR37_33670 [Kiritimatiellae bacterium]|nr:hypothetical protein [Kiritimatiellia bacterium]